MVGVPEDATRFAYMHPPDGIGELIDWGEYYHEYHNNEGAKLVKDNKSADGKPKDPTEKEKKMVEDMRCSLKPLCTSLKIWKFSVSMQSHSKRWITAFHFIFWSLGN